MKRYREIELKKRRMMHNVYCRQREGLKTYAQQYLLSEIQSRLLELKSSSIIYRRFKGDSLFHDEPMYWTYGNVVDISYNGLSNLSQFHSIFLFSCVRRIIQDYMEDQRWIARKFNVTLSPPASLKSFKIPSSWNSCEEWKVFPLIKDHSFTQDLIETLYESHVVLFKTKT